MPLGDQATASRPSSTRAWAQQPRLCVRFSIQLRSRPQRRSNDRTENWRIASVQDSAAALQTHAWSTRRSSGSYPGTADGHVCCAYSTKWRKWHRSPSIASSDRDVAWERLLYLRGIQPAQRSYSVNSTQRREMTHPAPASRGNGTSEETPPPSSESPSPISSSTETPPTNNPPAPATDQRDLYIGNAGRDTTFDQNRQIQELVTNLSSALRLLPPPAPRSRRREAEISTTTR
jgi:hypothetical protein